MRFSGPVSLSLFSSNATTSSDIVTSRRYVFGYISLRSIAVAAVSSFGLFPDFAAAGAEETVGKDPNCNDRSCLGVWDGLLADCPHQEGDFSRLGRIGGSGAGCVASQDDTPGIFAEPWDYSDAADYLLYRYEDEQLVMNKIVTAIHLVSAKRGDQVRILLREGRYLRVVFTDGRSQEESIGEFYITPNDTTVQFRVSSKSPSENKPLLAFSSSSLRNTDRAELIRKELRFLKLPVLRNRQRALFFVESDVLDTFGPGSAALGPPAEMKGRAGSEIDF